MKIIGITQILFVFSGLMDDKRLDQTFFGIIVKYSHVVDDAKPIVVFVNV